MITLTAGALGSDGADPARRTAWVEGWSEYKIKISYKIYKKSCTTVHVYTNPNYPACKLHSLVVIVCGNGRDVRVVVSKSSSMWHRAKRKAFYLKMVQ